MEILAAISDIVMCISVYAIVALLAHITCRLKINHNVARAIKTMCVLLVPAIACLAFTLLNITDHGAISWYLDYMWEPCAIYVFGGLSLILSYSAANRYFRPDYKICPSCQCQNTCTIGKIVETRLIRTTRPIFSNITNRQIDETDDEYTLYKREFKCEKCGHMELRWFTVSNTFANDYLD